MSDSSDNRRSARRIPARHNVWCEGTTLTLYTQTINLSATGAFVRAPQPLDPGTHLQLRFPDVGATFQTEVVWTRKIQRAPSSSDFPGMGVRFLEGEGRDAYEALLERLSEAQDRDPATGPRRIP